MSGGVRWIRSVAAAESVGAMVARECGVDVTGCVLVRSLTNDVYRVESAGGAAFACKVYGAGRWSTGQVAWEQDLAAHLARLGLTGAAPVPRSDGSLVGVVDAPEGARPYTVTEWAAGVAPAQCGLSPAALFGRFGAAVADFHTATDGFTSAHEPRLDDPLSTLDIALSKVDVAIAHEVAAAARPQLARATPGGVRHGDVSLDNVTVGPGDRIRLHDFDLSAIGCREADLVGPWGTPHGAAFLDGYRSRRAVDVGLLPALRVVELVRNLAWHLTAKAATRGAETIGDGWVEREIAALREVAAQL